MLVIAQRARVVTVEIERAHADRSHMKWEGEKRPYTCFEHGRGKGEPPPGRISEIRFSDRYLKVVGIDARSFAKHELELLDERTHCVGHAERPTCHNAGSEHDRRAARRGHVHTEITEPIRGRTTALGDSAEDALTTVARHGSRSYPSRRSKKGSGFTASAPSDRVAAHGYRTFVRIATPRCRATEKGALVVAIDCTFVPQAVVRNRSGGKRGDLLGTNHPERPAEEDAVVEAIDDVSVAVEQNVSDQEDLLSELGQMRHDRVAGMPLQKSIGGAGQPRALVLLNRVTKRLILGSARLRRALVTSLVQEGESVNSVAKRFEVTHQRISSILRRDKD